MMNEQYNAYTSETVQQFSPTRDERVMATLIYVLSFFTSLIAPLIIWLINREDSPFVDKVSKNYFNFLLSYFIWSILALISIFILIGIILVPVIALLNFIFTIVAAVKSYNGEDYLPPLSIKFFK